MQSQIVSGNAQLEGESGSGWFLGHFVTPQDDPRQTAALEVKWGVHQAGDHRPEWEANVEATTLTILIRGRFRLQLPEQELLLSREGDYVLWPPGTFHSWSAEETSTVLTIRWPSQPEDNVPQQASR